MVGGGKRFNNAPDRRLLNPETNEVVLLQRRYSHTFFFIPMQWWGPVAAVLGLIDLVSC